MITCYPQDGKLKSLSICTAFAEGCGGTVVRNGRYRGGASMFYGIDAANEAAWTLARVSMADWFYADNSFFDALRGRYFRVGRNRLQHPGTGTSDGSRFRALGLPIKPWRASGGHVLICPQSEHFMRVAARYAGNWLDDTLATLRTLTDRELRVRPWSRDKIRLAAELPAALAGAHALVTHSSASAITAILSGVPAIATAQCIVSPMCGALDTIENPLRPDNRVEWASVVADAQWTLDEMRAGLAWRSLHA